MKSLILLLCVCAFVCAIDHTGKVDKNEGAPWVRRLKNSIFGDGLEEKDWIPKDSRVLIVGAGASGMHMAMALARTNHTNVKVFESTSRVGGKSYTLFLKDGRPCDLYTKDERTGKPVRDIHCIPYDMGACFAHNGYEYRLWHLLDRYGVRRPTIRQGRSIFATGEMWIDGKIQECPDRDLDNSEYSYGMMGEREYKNGMAEDDIKAKQLQNELINGFRRYIAIHHEYMHQDDGYLMPLEKPTDDQLRDMAMPFSEFLESKGVGNLIPMLSFAYSAQGYGYLHEISAYYGMLWITPELSHGILQTVLHMENRVDPGGASSMLGNILRKLPRGIASGIGWIATGLKVGFHSDPTVSALMAMPDSYQLLWERIHKHEDINVEFGIQIESIDRHLDDEDAPIEVTYSQWKNGRKDTHTEEFDFLIWTPNPTQAFERTVEDTTNEERELFQSLHTFQLSTTIYQSTPVPMYSDRETNQAIAAWPQRTLDKNGANRWYLDRRDERFYGEDDKEILNFGTQTRVAYQFANKLSDGVDIDTPPFTISGDKEYMKDMRKMLLEDFEAAGMNTSTVEWLTDKVDLVGRDSGNDEEDRKAQFIWPYFPHWKPEQIAEGAPWKLDDLQGKHKTWYVGSFATFESILNVIDKNCMILGRFLGYDCQEGR